MSVSGIGEKKCPAVNLSGIVANESRPIVTGR